MNDECRIGVYICNCGTNIAKVVDADVVAARVAKLPGVVCARSYKYMCSNPGQEMIARDIYQHMLDRVVVAACSPRMHEPTFRKALEAAGTSSRWPTSASSAAGCTTIPRPPRTRPAT